jgi:hypothetical protein
MRALSLNEVGFVGAGNAQDTVNGTFEGTESPQSNTSGFGGACEAAAAIGGGAVGMLVAGSCRAFTGGTQPAACGFLGASAGTATATALGNVCRDALRP